MVGLMRITVALALVVCLGPGRPAEARERGAEAAPDPAPLAPVPSPATSPPPAAVPTWYRDVLPIVRTRCQACHVPGGVGPFSLQTPADAKERLPAIVRALKTKYMPPWQAADGCQSFRDVRRLTSKELTTVFTWAKAGAPDGEPSQQAPPLPRPESGLTFAELSVRWQPATRKEETTHCFAFDLKPFSARDLIGFEVRPGVSGVQHVTFYSATNEVVNAADAAHSGLGWDCPQDIGAFNGEPVGFWAPGTPLTLYPPDTGVRLPAGRPLVMQVQFAEGFPAAEAPVTRLKLFFAAEPVSRTAHWVPLWKAGLSLPPHSVGFTVGRTQPPPLPGALLGVFPHMHVLGRRIRLQRGNTCIIDLPLWDSSAQQAYFFENMTGVPLHGTEPLDLTCTWNNPSARKVPLREASGSEMCLSYLYIAE